MSEQDFNGEMLPHWSETWALRWEIANVPEGLGEARRASLAALLREVESKTIGIVIDKLEKL